MKKWSLSLLVVALLFCVTVEELKKNVHSAICVLYNFSQSVQSTLKSRELFSTTLELASVKQ